LKTDKSRLNRKDVHTSTCPARTASSFFCPDSERGVSRTPDVPILPLAGSLICRRSLPFPLAGSESPSAAYLGNIQFGSPAPHEVNSSAGKATDCPDIHSLITRRAHHDKGTKKQQGSKENIGHDPEGEEGCETGQKGFQSLSVL